MVETSVKLEEQSVQLYERLAEKIPESSIKKIFKLLGDEEKQHVAIFSQMAGRITYEMALEYKQEHIDALLEHFRTKIISPEKMGEKIRELKDVDSIFKFAISIELDHIMFYTEIKEFLRKEDKELVNDLIEEERRHFLKLMQYRKSLS